jgi:hypothetical protein
MKDSNFLYRKNGYGKLLLAYLGFFNLVVIIGKNYQHSKWQYKRDAQQTKVDSNHTNTIHIAYNTSYNETSYQPILKGSLQCDPKHSLLPSR